MFSDVEGIIKRGNKILFTRHSESLQNLMTAIRLQNHRVLILWDWIVQTRRCLNCNS